MKVSLGEAGYAASSTSKAVPGWARRPLAQDELKFHTILRRRLTFEEAVTASHGNRIALASSIGTEAAQVGEEIICACRAAHLDAEGHPVHAFDLPVSGQRKHRLLRQAF